MLDALKQLSDGLAPITALGGIIFAVFGVYYMIRKSKDNSEENTKVLSAISQKMDKQHTDVTGQFHAVRQDLAVTQTELKFSRDELTKHIQNDKTEKKDLWDTIHKKVDKWPNYKFSLV